MDAAERLARDILGPCECPPEEERDPHEQCWFCERDAKATALIRRYARAVAREVMIQSLAAMSSVGCGCRDAVIKLVDVRLADVVASVPAPEEEP